MLERAEWRKRADDPLTPLGWLVGMDRWHGVPVYPFVAGTVFVAMVLRALIERALPVGWDEAFGSVCGTLLMFGALTLLTPSGRRKEALGPDPAPGNVHSSTVRIKHSDRCLGEDAGVLVFNEGWLLFEGASTSFALCRDDVDQIYRIGDARHFDLRGGHRLEFEVAVEPRAFRDDLDRWMREPSATGLSRLPPVERHPRQKLRKTALLQLFSAGLLGGSLSIALTSLPGSSNPLLMAKVVFVGIVSAAFLAVVARYGFRRAA